MKRFLIVFAIVLSILFSVHPAATAESALLVPCNQSQAFQDRQQNAPDNYYYQKPFQAYASELVCGKEDGLPHLQLRLDRAIDIVIPFALFFYIAGFIGWSGRAYLLAANRSTKPEEQEIFINLAIAVPALIQGLLWPILALKELGTGELTAKNAEISVSPR
ncbi:Photosystem I reaction center subunit III [Leptolyngbya sp. AN03gr2]|uniref:Photosystem I reaction center subunit III n=1 Tax=unclassified Leptolyngbya TaxID=2650499 RepID=UPI003D310EE4